MGNLLHCIPSADCPGEDPNPTSLSSPDAEYRAEENTSSSLILASEVGDEANIILVLPSGERRVSIPSGKCLVQAVARAIGLKPQEISLSFENNHIESGLTDIDCCIVPDSRVTVDIIDIRIKTNEKVERLCNEMVELNPHTTAADLKGLATFDTDGHLRDWILSSRGLKVLPESFGNLTVGGCLNLFDNQLAALPKSFGNITVGGDLILRSNMLATLPEKFGDITLGGSLDLYNNKLASLPRSFGNITLRGNLNLCYNKLGVLPECIGNMVIEGELYLSHNPGVVGGDWPKRVRLRHGDKEWDKNPQASFVANTDTTFRGRAV